MINIERLKNYLEEASLFGFFNKYDEEDIIEGVDILSHEALEVDKDLISFLVILLSEAVEDLYSLRGRYMNRESEARGYEALAKVREDHLELRKRRIEELGIECSEALAYSKTLESKVKKLEEEVELLWQFINYRKEHYNKEQR